MTRDRGRLGVGLLAAVSTFQPSLMPKHRSDQVLAVTGATLTAAAAAAFGARSLRLLPPRLRPGGPFAAVGALAGAAVLSRLRPPPDPVPLRSVAFRALGWSLVAGALARAAAPLTASPLRLAASTAGAAGAAVALDRATGAGRGRGAARELAAGTALSFAVDLLTETETWTARWMAERSAAAAGGRPSRWLAATGPIAVAPTVVTIVGAARRVVEAAEAAEDRVEPGYGEPPTQPTVSGGPGSLVAYDDLTVEGRRFVSEAAGRQRIAEVTGTAVAEPIRVYVGVGSAPTVGERVELAVDELERTGAFTRSTIIVASPAGTGYVNPIAVEAAEYLTGGDVATVAIQYGKRPSVLSPDRVHVGARQNHALLEAIADRLDGLDSPPRLVVYGESLGARTGQDAFDLAEDDAEPARHDRFGIAAALWVGTPYRSRWRYRALAVGPSYALGFTNGAAIREARRSGRRWCHSFLDHPEDPVTRFDVSLLTHRPSWLDTDGRPASVPARERWVPAATFWLTAVDTNNAADVVPGEFRAHGHDYRADLAAAISGAFDLPVDDGTLAAIERRLRRSERDRAARISRS